MPEIIVEDVTGQRLSSVEVPAGRVFADVAMEAWPNGWPGFSPIVYDDLGLEVPPEHAVDAIMGADQTYKIVLAPQGPVAAVMSTALITAVGGGTLLTVGQALLFVASLAASVLLAPKVPKLGDAGGYEWDEESRPQFMSGQSNQFRPGSRVADVFGRIRVYPDLIARSVIEYFGPDQTIDEMYVVSNGKVACTNFRILDNDSDILPNFVVDVYHPGDTWPSDFKLITQNEFVANTALIAPNDVPLNDLSLTFSNAGATISADIEGIFQAVEVGKTYLLQGAGINASNRTFYEIVAINVMRDQITVSPAPPVDETVVGAPVTFGEITEFLSGDATAPFYWYANNWRNWTDRPNSFIPKGFLENAPSGFNGLGTNRRIYGQNDRKLRDAEFRSSYYAPGGDSPIGGSFLTIRGGAGELPADQNHAVFTMLNSVPPYDPDDPDAGFATPSFIVPGDQTVEIWIDIEFPRGLYTQSSGQAPTFRTVEIEVGYREARTSDVFVKETMTFTDTTRNARRFTYKITGLDPKEYEVQLKRLTNTNLETGTSVTADVAQWLGLRGVQQPSSDLLTNPLDVTLARIRFSTENLSLTLSNRRFNCVATRVLPNYRGDQSERTTQLISDALLYTLLSQENYPLAQIDTAQLWAIQDELDAIGSGGYAGQFNGIIDQPMPTEDQLVSIGSVGRIMIYRRAGTIHFSRVGPNEAPVALYNNRNKTQFEVRTLAFSEVNDPDAIIVRYRDEEDDWAEAEYQYPENVTPIAPKTITLLGVTRGDIAQRRARFEWDRMILQKDALSLSATEEGMLQSPGDVIAVTDSLLSDPPLQGEVRDVSGTTFTFDRVIPAGTYTGRIRDEFGALLHQSQVVIAADSNVQTISGWTGAVMPPDASGVGLLYEFVLDADAPKELWVVTGVQPGEDGSTTTISGIRYGPDIYQADV